MLTSTRQKKLNGEEFISKMRITNNLRNFYFRYGHTYKEAIMKIGKEIKEKNPVVPHKIVLRSRLIEQLQQAGIQEVTENLEAQESSSNSSSWMNKMNPFAKKEI